MEFLRHDFVDLREVCTRVQQNFSGTDFSKLIHMLVDIVFLDGINPDRIKSLVEIFKLLDISTDSIELYKKIYEKEFNRLDKDISILTFDAGSQADMPEVNMKGAGAILFYEFGYKLLVISGGGLYVNGISIEDPDIVELHDDTLLGIGDYRFYKNDLKHLLYKKANLSENKYFAVNNDGELKLRPFNESGETLAEITHVQNKLLIRPNHDKNELLINNARTATKNTMTDNGTVVVYDQDRISFQDIAGYIQFEQIEHDEWVADRKEEQKEDLKLQFNLNSYDSDLSVNCILEAREIESGWACSLNNYTGEIYKNKIALKGPFITRRGDFLKIGKATVKFDHERAEIHIFRMAIQRLSVQNISVRFPSSRTDVLHSISINVNAGEIHAILGPAGSGKSTLLGAIIGMVKIHKGSLKINDQELPMGLRKFPNILGYVPQDDLLVENLTVRENLFFRYLLRHPGCSTEEAEEKTINILQNVGLIERINSSVGSASERILSGGERKRLNIALELISEPDILLLDEPTSGLSSEDAFEIVSLLRELSNRGKIVLLVIHQPSSSIYRMFNSVSILLKGGRQAFSGRSMEAIKLFSRVSGDLPEDVECGKCRQLNPEFLMKSLKSGSFDFWETVGQIQTVSESTDHKIENDRFEPVTRSRKFFLKEKMSQVLRQFQRAFLTKLRNRMNVIITVLVAPGLSILTSMLLRYNPDPKTSYNFADNEMYPVFLFLIVIVAIFLGLSNSVPDIIKDQLLLKREKLLNISIGAFFLIKFTVLTVFTLIQNTLFILPAHLILEEYHMIPYHIVIMTLIACCAISLGLLVSAFLKSMTAAYNLVPLILVPQIVLAGAIVSYDKMNRSLLWNQKSPIPPVAQIMISRWGYELIFTANIDLHTVNRIIYRRNNNRKELNSRLRDGEITTSERNKMRQLIGKKLKNKLEKAYLDYNKTIHRSEKVPYNKYLSRYNGWFNGYLRTWERNALILLCMTGFLLLLGYIIIIKKKR